jgi:CDP-4-dehydro-6-deoxyglucose reductase
MPHQKQSGSPKGSCMTFIITATGCGSFTAEAENNLLEAGLAAGFGFPHACRNGNCERCLATLNMGCVTYPGNLGERIRERHGEKALLCCQAHPASNCSFAMPGLTAPGELPLMEKTCQKMELALLSDDVSLLRLRLPAGKSVEWHAGQYVSLHLGDRWVPYSIANAPRPGERELQIHFRHLGHHASAQQSLAWLQQHDLIRVRLPKGHCFIDRLPDRPLWFICGSTGFSQAHAMLQFLADQSCKTELRLFWGVRKLHDLYLPDAPARLGKHLPGLVCEQLLSDDNQPGYGKGFAHERALTLLEKPDEPLFYISGSPAMVEAVNQALRDAGVTQDQIRSDML